MRETEGPSDSSAGALHGRSAQALYRMLGRALRTSAEVDDVVQTVWERYIRTSRAKRIEQPSGWLFAIARNVLREHFSLRKRDDPLLADPSSLEEIEDSEAHALPDDSERLNLEKQLEAALAALTPNERRVILAVKHDGMSHEEAAEATGISLFMVRKHLVDAKAKLMDMTWDR